MNPDEFRFDQLSVEDTAEQKAEMDRFYTKIRGKVKEWAEGKGVGNEWSKYVLAAPDLFVLLARLLLDDRVRFEDKSKLAFAIAYFISPIDLMPEAILGPIGYLDDIALAAWVLNRMLGSLPREALEEHWEGDSDLLDFLKKTLDSAEQMVGKNIWGRVKSMMGK